MSLFLPACAAAGIASWPALEYALHRFLAHEAPFASKFKTEHLKHHRSVDYFVAGRDKLLAAVPASAVLFTAAAAVLRGAAGASAYTAGFFACYLFYEWAHKRFHTHPPATRLGLVLRKHHILHHCVDARGNHGVTTRLFDRLFGTMVTSEQAAVPRSIAPRWLFAPDGTIAAPYRADFRLLA